MLKNAINWFEIPVSDFERACKFYGTILDGEIQKENMGGAEMGFLPCEHAEGAVGGAIVHSERSTPSDKGTMVYLNGGDDLTTILNRIESAGGTIVVPKTKITDEIGFFAQFKDTEGNLLALHSRG